ncbi:dTDP-4-dehydrorhamnose 3,5-epimerase [Desulfonatronospira sp.]|uniref:dTDP-4-dehydrorhamnose 3,5-epimerase n=1 Tax=Desulfonatronospira sp. TaxID=1962951 RepID=UPI0025C60FF4|nr:dTDP-4-dehydrorhamnose 3,5-epimerase [Desulfonatronospira sp.]
MQFKPTEIADVVMVEPRVLGDERGYFMESFRQDIFSREIPGVNFIQDNESSSLYGVLRGLHYQLPPFAQAKLVRVVTGRVLDVCVDIRSNSPDFGRHVAVELSGENKRQVFIPGGFAHGFLVLSSHAVFQYKVDQVYSRDHERGIAWDDPRLGIDWGIGRDEMTLSDKDAANPHLEDAEIF